jgi:hypothetical protein
MGYAPVNNTIVFIGTKENIVDFLNIGLKTSHLPAIDGKDYRGFIDFLMRNARHYEVDRSICAGGYHANGLTMGTFCTDGYMNVDNCDYNFKVRFGCDFDAEINSMCATTINGYYSLELTVETNNCPPELWVKNIKEKVGFTYAFIHAADYDENCFNYFKEIDDADEHEFKENHFEIEANAENDNDRDCMMDALNDRITDCFANYIFEKTKE